MNKSRIYFLTGNANKLREVQDVAQGSNKEFLGHELVGLTEIQGTSDEICMSKAEDARKIVANNRLPYQNMIIEDTSLVFSCMDQFGRGGLPGPYIKDFLANMTLDSIAAMVGANNAAQFHCKIVYVTMDWEMDPVVFTGTIHGTIVPPRNAAGSFGWDSIFVPAGQSKTYAEMTADEKRACSARAVAVRDMLEHLK